LEDESDPRVGLVAERNPLRGEIEQWLDAAAPEPRE
jgi:hypothetical protein